MNQMKKSNATPVIKGRPLTYRLTNDYLFRAMLQKSPKALEGLCRAILGLKPTDEVSIVIKNPIILGEAIEDKEFILDLLVEINGFYVVNLEMQVVRTPNWKDRSLSYACRCFDTLQHGEEYRQTSFVHHVAFLDFSLFPDTPEFFSTYKLLNIKNPTQIFDDKFTISVVDLTHTELATEEDRANSLELWAKVFKASTWEELDMLAKENEYVKSAVVTVAELTEDERIRQRLQARKDFEYWERIRLNQMETQTKELAEANATIAEQASKLAEQDSKISKQNSKIAELLAEIAVLKADKQ